MALDMNNAYKRYTKIVTECDYLERKRREQCEAAVKALKNITDASVEVLVKQYPELAVVRNYTVDDLMRNANNECQVLRDLYNKISVDTDAALLALEKQLCLT